MVVLAIYYLAILSFVTFARDHKSSPVKREAELEISRSNYKEILILDIVQWDSK